MKATVMLWVLLATMGISALAEAQLTPTCRTGTELSVNPNRQLAPGESFVMVPGGIVTITQRETVGSSHIVFRRCILSPQEVAVGGIKPWVKACGQDIVPEGWTIPGMKPRDGLDGAPGKPGAKGDNGDPGARRSRNRPSRLQRVVGTALG